MSNQEEKLLTCTIKAPYFSYAQLGLSVDGPDKIILDDLQVRSYCTAALKQFLGLTGLAIPIDILKVEASGCWLRLPREDVGKFVAAITAYEGTSEGNTQYVLLVKQSSDWLGTMLAAENDKYLWGEKQVE